MEGGVVVGMIARIGGMGGGIMRGFLALNLKAGFNAGCR